MLARNCCKNVSVANTLVREYVDIIPCRPGKSNIDLQVFFLKLQKCPVEDWKSRKKERKIWENTGNSDPLFVVDTKILDKILDHFV